MYTYEVTEEAFCNALGSSAYCDMSLVFSHLSYDSIVNVLLSGVEPELASITSFTTNTEVDIEIDGDDLFFGDPDVYVNGNWILDCEAASGTNDCEVYSCANSLTIPASYVPPTSNSTTISFEEWCCMDAVRIK